MNELQIQGTYYLKDFLNEEKNKGQLKGRIKSKKTVKKAPVSMVIQ